MKYWIFLGTLSQLLRGHRFELTDEAKSAIWLANDEFALDVLKKLPFENENSIFSPLSISATFAMISLGARKNTLDEIKKTFHFNEVDNVSSDEMALHEHFAGIMQIFAIESAYYDSYLANRLYVKKNFDILEKFVKETEEYYHVSVGKVNFGDGKAENEINQWIAKQTQNKIENLYHPHFFTDDTVLALVNAIYFSAKWKTAFKRFGTQDSDFYVNQNETKTVKMMEVTSMFDVAQDNNMGIELIRLPYVGENLNMIIVLPEPGKLSEFISKLTVQIFRSLLKKLESKKVNLKMPKIKLESKYHLKEILKNLNLNDLFDGRANLSGISTSPLQVSSVIHKAFIDVSEKGTKAAAATTVDISFKSLSDYASAEDFVVDRPFFYSIVDRRFENVMLFTGTVVNP